MAIANQQYQGAVLSANFSGQRVDFAQFPDAVPLDDDAAAPEVYIEDDDGFAYAESEDAQCFMQPTISRAATRMISHTTPAVEKAAAMGAEYPYGLCANHTDLGPESEQEAVAQVWRPSYNPSTNGGLPDPWTAGPKEFVVSKADVPKPDAPKAALSSVFGKTRHKRSSSVGTDALKKLTKALPSLSMSSSRLSGTSTGSLGSSSGSPKNQENHFPKPHASHQLQHPDPSLPHPHQHYQSQPQSYMRVVTDLTAAGDGALTSRPSQPSQPSRPSRPLRPEVNRLASTASRTSHGLRRTASDESLLYHSLSRVSSFGDDARFEEVRSQVNSRFKAIMDSLPDRPSFKLPQVSNFFPSQTDIGDQNATRSLPRHPAAPIPPKDPVPDLDSVLETLTGDVIVLGGYRGSILRSAKPPNRQLWVPVKVGLNIRQVDLEVGLEAEDEELMEQNIYPAGMLQNIGPVDISRRLFRKLRDCENARTGLLRIHDFGYDWRLSPHLASRKLISFLEALPSNQPGTPTRQRGALVLAHSLGGLITRHAVNKRPELFSGVVFAGSPQRCVNILGPLRNGDAVLLNEKVLTAQVNFSIRTSFTFLPEDGFCFVNKTTGEEYPVDFYNVDDWIRYRWSPCIEPSIQSANTAADSSNKRKLLSSIPFISRARSSSEPKGSSLPSHHVHSTSPHHNDRTIAPQISSHGASHPDSIPEDPLSASFQQTRNLAYLHRTLAQTRQFRAELAHRLEFADANLYPPLGVIYGKDTPTVYAASVASREDIAGPNAYDDLVYRSGDGVVLAREAMLPPGYQLVKGGRVSTTRGHVSIFGDLEAVGRAIGAVVRGRRKGIGMGVEGLLY